MKSFIFGLYIFVTITTLHAEDNHHGSELHSKHCVGCHSAMTGGDGTVLYTRHSRTVGSLDELESRVQYCQSSLELNWTSSQNLSVKQYLNQSYYKF